ncbi:YdeI/OmpD-associated family protein [Glaciihabitans sp. UYNi722]|uniref:YdeI/OmpD-associated family protein n=1 Tax=Glaciihabitans sp. UYNi722 TaxID=3156344 RepID=UPI003392B514
MRYQTTMLQIGNNTGIPVPPDIVDALGGGKRAAVNVVVNGYAYRSTIAAMRGQFLISFSSDKRADSGITGGDALDIELTLDTQPRTVTPPPDFAAALDVVSAARAAFDALSPSKQKAHVTSIEGAKTAETRARRVAAAVEGLSTQ